MQLTCPACHARFPLEAAVQDDAGRELLGLLATTPAEIATPLVSYLGYFRATKTQLAWSRALRLASEVLAIGGATREALAAALDETVAAMAEKRAQAGWRPLDSHNYLRRVLESTTGRLEARAAVQVTPASPAAAPRSWTGQGLVALEEMKSGRGA